MKVVFIWGLMKLAMCVEFITSTHFNATAWNTTSPIIFLNPRLESVSHIPETHEIYSPIEYATHLDSGSRSRVKAMNVPSVSILSVGVMVIHTKVGSNRSALDEALNEVRRSASHGAILLVDKWTGEVEKIRYFFDLVLIYNDNRVETTDPCVIHLGQGETCNHTVSASSVVSECTSNKYECTLGPRSYRTVFLGDWGALGEGLSQTSRVVNSGFYDSYIFGGDNIYEIGISNPEDDKMTDVYADHFGGVRVPQFVVEGNHDGYGNYLAQLLYSQHKPDSWVAPFYYHHHQVNLRSTSVCFLFIDTNRWELSGQIGFIESTLSSKDCQRSDFIVVVGHHPVFSCGGHGDDIFFRKVLHPILTRYKVDLYISGHDHQNSVHADSGVNFVVAGAASKKTTSPWYTSTSNAEKTLHKDFNIYSFASLEFKGESATCTLVNSETGSDIFHLDLTSRKPDRQTAPVRADGIPITGQRPWSSGALTILVGGLILAWIGGSLLIDPSTIIQVIFNPSS
jgi:tartrate-resistant acid phosphatase type 5